MALLRLPVFLLFVLCSQAEDDLTLTVYDQPGPLSPSAITSDWPRFLGPSDDASTPETHLIHSFPETGPKLLWEVTKGEGYTSPAIVQDQLILFHNVEDIDRIESRHPETGALQWTYTYPNRYRDRYGYGTGPRAAPVISGEYVLTLSATSQLHCLHRKDGSLKWKRDLLSDYQPGPYFFGHGPCPLVWNDLVLLPIGGKGVSVAAFDLESGETRWEARHPWKASYASPVLSTGEPPRLLVFGGGESRPSIGGLLSLDPETGDVLGEFPWRAEKFESVNASTPLRLSGNQVLVGETYELGSSLLQLDETGAFQTRWTAPELKLHWMTPIQKGPYLYAYSGRNEPDAGLDCWSLQTGERLWREEVTWKKQVGPWSYGWGFFRGTLLKADQKVFALGEMGTLALLELSPEGMEITCQAELFSADQSWVLPAISRGLLYVSQNRPDLGTKAPPRLLCYDLRR